MDFNEGYIKLTDLQYANLTESIGETELYSRMSRLSKLKKDNKRARHMKSDFQALLAMGSRRVEPIKNRESIQALKQILVRSSERDYFLFVLGLNTGLRISDLLELRAGDVRGRRHLEKRDKHTGQTKQFPLNKDLRSEVDNYTKDMLDTEYLFASKKTGAPLNRDRAYKVLKEAAIEAGISNFGTHTMRKTFGYHFYLKYEDAAILQKLFNHSSLSVTLKYIGISQEEIEAGLDEFSL